MEMNVSVEDLSVNQKKLQVIIPARKVQEEIEKRYRDLGERVKIKGFRPGKVPRSILKSYYGKTIEHEVSSQFIQDTFPDALRESELKPLAEADVDQTRFEDDGAFIYTAIVDVCPPFEVGEYKELKARRSPVTIDESKQQEELERIRRQHAELRTLESDRPIQEGDMVLVDFTPYVDGNAFEKGKTNDFMMEVGKKTLHPDFDQHLLGRRAGENLSFDLDYAEDASLPEVAGKRVHFEVVVREIKEKILPELDDDFAQVVGAQFETLDALKQEIADQLRKQEEERARREVQQQIMEQLLGKTQFELSPKVIDREVNRLIELLQHQFQSQGLQVDTFKFDTPEIRAEYRPQAERNVRWHLILHRIAEQEKIELSEDELEDVYRNVARLARVDVEKVRSEYQETGFVEQAKESKLEEKVFKFLEDEAVYVEAPDEEKSTDQE